MPSRATLTLSRHRADSPSPEDRVVWHNAIKKRMEAIDALPPDIRALVHEYGWEPVKLLMDLGAKRARHIEHIIRACRGIGQEERILR